MPAVPLGYWVTSRSMKSNPGQLWLYPGDTTRPQTHGIKMDLETWNNSDDYNEILSRATVRVDNQYTPTFHITHGERQGDALSAILFDLVLEAIFQKMNITGHIGIKSSQILAYADDVAIVSRKKCTKRHPRQYRKWSKTKGPTNQWK